MLNFQLNISENRVIFNFQNNSDKLIHCLSYKFKSFWENKLIQDFNPHEFFFNINPNESKTKEFGQVNISQAYLAGNTNPNEYEIKVWIRYFVCGEEEIKQVSSSIKYIIKGKN